LSLEDSAAATHCRAYSAGGRREGIDDFARKGPATFVYKKGLVASFEAPSAVDFGVSFDFNSTVDDVADMDVSDVFGESRFSLSVCRLLNIVPTLSESS